MNLTKLFETQRVLDERIMEQHPELRGQNNLDWKILALQVELGECANEWRGFKKWSNYQKPRIAIHTTQGANAHNTVYYQCGNEDCARRFEKDDERLNDLFGKNDDECPVCDEGLLYAFRKKNPLLEEYVYCLHFVLSIGLEFDNYPLNLNYEVLGFIEEAWNTKNTIEQFQVVYKNIADFSSTCDELEYIELVSQFLGLGEMLGFIWEQVEQAYYEKNAINHERQRSGY